MKDDACRNDGICGNDGLRNEMNIRRKYSEIYEYKSALFARGGRRERTFSYMNCRNNI